MTALPTWPGAVIVLPSGYRFMLHTSGLWHDTNGRSYPDDIMSATSFTVLLDGYS